MNSYFRFDPRTFGSIPGRNPSQNATDLPIVRYDPTIKFMNEDREIILKQKQDITDAEYEKI